MGGARQAKGGAGVADVGNSGLVVAREVRRRPGEGALRAKGHGMRSRDEEEKKRRERERGGRRKKTMVLWVFWKN